MRAVGSDSTPGSLGKTGVLLDHHLVVIVIIIVLLDRGHLRGLALSASNLMVILIAEERQRDALIWNTTCAPQILCGSLLKSGFLIGGLLFLCFINLVCLHVDGGRHLRAAPVSTDPETDRVTYLIARCVLARPRVPLALVDIDK